MHHDPCSLFKFKPLYSIAFCGDSYIRQAYQALLLILSGNYESGSVPPDYAQECAGNLQFHERECRFFVKACDCLCQGRVFVKLFYSSWCIPNSHMLATFDKVIWGGGSHPVNSDYGSRLGVNNASLVGEHILKPTCAELNTSEVEEKLIFMLPHARLGFITNDESRDAIKTYRESMPEMLELHCNIKKIIDTFGFTESAIDMLPPEILDLLSYDKNHWSRSINVIKGWMVLNTVMP